MSCRGPKYYGLCGWRRCSAGEERKLEMEHLLAAAGERLMMRKGA
jgi:hypothetical protein